MRSISSPAARHRASPGVHDTPDATVCADPTAAAPSAAGGAYAQASPGFGHPIASPADPFNRCR